MEFALSDAFDAGQAAETYARTGSVTLAPFLQEESAVALHGHLRERNDWKQVLNSGDKLFEFDRATRAGLSGEQSRALDDAVYAGARRDFQFRYETIRVADEDSERVAAGDVLNAFARFLSHGAAREVLRSITGDDGIAFADAQATAYAPGDFLTNHDDDVAGKNRSAAHILSLNPEWRVEWGGLLLRHGEHGQTAEALVPGWNRMTLLRVPQVHSVSEVTRATPFRRYSVTGWLRR